jgi:hypothetical protein
MKKTIGAFLVYLAAVSSSFAGYGAYEAAQAGLITLSGYAFTSYSEAAITVTNVSGVGLDIDFSTIYFMQADGSQRIGLAYELTSGAYYLHFNAGYSGELHFSSRCLDLNRHAPVSGVAFSQYGLIAAQFSTIITALRNNAAQGDIWTLTDSSGAFSDAWKAADPRYVAPVTIIQLLGSSSWRTLGSKINIKVSKVSNLSTSGKSGSLRLRVWATKSKYRGGRIRGYVLGTRDLDGLSAGYYYSKINGYVALHRPPSRTYYSAITLEEFTTSGWVIRDFVSFRGKVKF